MFGTAIGSFGPIVADDTTTPTVQSITINFATDTITVTMSENIRCAELSLPDFTITVGGAPVGIGSYVNCAGTAHSVFDIVLAQDVTSGQVVVTRNPAGGLFNEQGNLDSTGSANV